MKSNEKRLKKIEQRCEKLGWNWCDFVDVVTDLCSAMGLDSGDDNWHPVAERLLACYEPGHVIRIKHICDGPLEQEVDCNLMVCGMCTLRFNENEDCPGEGSFKLVRRDDES